MQPFAGGVFASGRNWRGSFPALERAIVQLAEDFEGRNWRGSFPALEHAEAEGKRVVVQSQLAGIFPCFGTLKPRAIIHMAIVATGGDLSLLWNEAQVSPSIAAESRNWLGIFPALEQLRHAQQLDRWKSQLAGNLPCFESCGGSPQMQQRGSHLAGEYFPALK